MKWRPEQEHNYWWRETRALWEHLFTTHITVYSQSKTLKYRQTLEIDGDAMIISCRDYMGIVKFWRRYSKTTKLLEGTKCQYFVNTKSRVCFMIIYQKVTLMVT